MWRILIAALVASQALIFSFQRCQNACPAEE
jgi:hypothetical protein